MASKTKMEQIAEERKALLDEGFLCEQFEELEALQTPDDCAFVEDIFNMFLNDMGGLFSQIEKELAQDFPDTQVLDKRLHQIKGSTASVGAKQLSIICNEMRENALKGDIQNCRDAFVRMENQLLLLGQRIGAYFELCKQDETGGSACLSSDEGSAAAKDDVKGKAK